MFLKAFVKRRHFEEGHQGIQNKIKEDQINNCEAGLCTLFLSECTCLEHTVIINPVILIRLVFRALDRFTFSVPRFSRLQCRIENQLFEHTIG